MPVPSAPNGPAGESVRAWAPAVSGVVEVLHARFHDHAYPLHTHDAWTLMVLDEGAVRYDLDRHEHAALTSRVTLLPPHVPHDGRSATGGAFRKRVVYLDTTVLGEELAGRAVDSPDLSNPLLDKRIRALDTALGSPGEVLAAQSHLALVRDALHDHLDAQRAVLVGREPRLAHRLRDLLDAHVVDGVDLRDAAALLGATDTHLVRAFSREFGLPPHRYLTGRRVDLARRHLLAGMPAAQVATAAGFHDQAHLTRHLRRYLGTTPAAYARSVA